MEKKILDKAYDYIYMEVLLWVVMKATAVRTKLYNLID